MNLKPRNHIVLAMLKTNKNTQKHGKSEKTVRRDEKAKLKNQVFNKNLLKNY